MKIEQMREFLILSETLNFSEAAKKLFISQPTLSRHILAMEEELSFKLVSSSSHGVELTEEGKDAVHSFKKILNEYSSFREHVRGSNQINGKLTVGLLYYAIDEYFSDFLSQFQETYPGIEITYRNGTPQSVLDDLCEGKTDIASLFYSKELSIPEFCFVPIAYTEMVAMIHEDNPLCKKEEVSLEELSKYPLIELRDDSYSNDITNLYLKHEGIHFDEKITTANIETVPMTIRATGGIHLTGASCERQKASFIEYKAISKSKYSPLLTFCALEEENPVVACFIESAKSYYTLKK